MEELYKQYGEKMIQLEILNAQVNELKKKIAEELNKKPVTDPEKTK